MSAATAQSAQRERLHKHLEKICIPRDVFEDSKNLIKVQDYIASQLTHFGYLLREHSFVLKGRKLVNLIARKNFDCPAKLLVGAHFDSVPGTPGADDNASGVAALLETAEALAKHPAAEHIEFAAFNGEEYGMVGSSAYAAELKKNRAQLKGMLSLEMMGYRDSSPGTQKIPAILKPFYPDTGDFLALIGDTRSISLLTRAERSFRKVRDDAGNPLKVHGLFVPARGWMLPAVRLSDHSPFWDLGYPALLVTDTSFFRNPHYHKESDTIESLDIEFLKANTDGVIRFCRDFTVQNP